uniref:NACHT domain-containing protein n=1 Tax=Strigamia maritima TaxID=126957 RepID=T1J835_STRMM
MDDQAVDRIFLGDLNDLPPVSSKIVRIFTSSTFTDTSMERNTLMEQVYPKLKDYCRERHGLEFQVVDMRWGVRDEATDDHMTTELCMKEIQNCQRLSMGPNFVVFLGQKYGYRPIPTIILGTEFVSLRQALVSAGTDVSLLDTWYKEDANSVPSVYILQPISSILINFSNKRTPKLQAQDQATWWLTLEKMQKLLRKAAEICLNQGIMDKDAVHNYFMSVTEREVINGILNVKNTKNTCLGYLRYINNINLGNAKAACKYVDMIGRAVDNEAGRLLANLRDERVPTKLESSNISRYTIEWIGREGLDADTHEEYLQQFITHFYRSISKLVDRAMRKEDQSSLGQIVTEILQHLHTCNGSVKVFYGRKEDLARIHEYITGNNDRPFVLHGDGGCGKTSLLAKTASLIPEWMAASKPQIILRFLGTTPDSSSVAPLLRSLCQQISYNLMLPLENIPEELVPLTAYLKNLLTSATPVQGIIVLLDSMDQLASLQGNKMSWLPTRLPTNVKMLLSCASDAECSEDFNLLNRMIDCEANFLQVLPLGHELAALVIQKWLDTSCRCLAPPSQNELVETALSHCTLPIFVKLVFAEVSRWKSYTKSQDTVLASTVTDSINRLFERIEMQHGKTLVFHALAYITSAKSGLSETELEDLISLDDRVLEDVYQYHLPPVRRIPPLLWTRIRNDLPNYLSEREADGVSVLNWYHRQFRDAACERYFKNLNMAVYFHSSIADYFLGIWGGGQPKPFKYTEIQRQRFGLTDKEGTADRKVPLQPLIFSSKDGKVRYNLRKLGELPFHLIRARRNDDLFNHVLFNYEWLHAKLSCCALQATLSDFEDAYRHLSDKETKRQVLLVADAMRLGGAILAQYPDMLAPQLVGRLLPEMLNNKHVYSLLEQCDRLGPKNCGLLPVSHCMHTPGGPLKYSLEGHQFAVFGFGLTSDCKYVMSMSNRFIIWDLSTSDISRNVNLEIHGIVQGMAVSPDDRFVAGYTNNDEVIIVHALTGDLYKIKQLMDGQATVVGLALTETYVFVWSKDKCIKYDLVGVQIDEKSFTARKSGFDCILKIDFLTDKTYDIILWSGEEEKEEMLLESFTEETALQPLEFHSALVTNKKKNSLFTCVGNSKTLVEFKKEDSGWCQVRALSENSEKILQLRLWEEIGCILATIMIGFKVWYVNSDRVIKLILPPDVRNIGLKPMISNSAAISKSEQYLVAGVRKDLYVWDLETEELLKVLDAHFGRIMQLVPLIDDEWNSVITSSIDRTVKVWNINNIFEQVHVIDRHDMPVNFISISPVTARAATATRNCTGIWSMRTGRLLYKLVDAPVGAIVTQALITCDGSHLVSLENDNFLIWHIDNQQVIKASKIPHANVRQLVLFENDTLALVLARDGDTVGRVTVRSVPAGDTVYQVEFNFKIFRQVVVSADNKYLVAMAYEKSKDCLFVYDARSGEFLHKVIPKYPKMKEVSHLVAMPNRSSYVALIDPDKGNIIDIKNKKLVRSIVRKYGLYAPSRGGLELIELRHGNTVRTFIPRVAEGVYAIDTVFTKTDEYVIYYHSRNHTLRVFRMSDAGMIANYKLNAELNSIQCMPDGYSCLVGTSDGCITTLTIVDPHKDESRVFLQNLPSRKDPSTEKRSNSNSSIDFKKAAILTKMAVTLSKKKPNDNDNDKTKDTDDKV